jgi:cold shock CspA family protein
MEEVGTVKMWNEEKAYGFIIRKNNLGDIFVHLHDCRGGRLWSGQTVSFEVAEHRGRTCAKSVTVIEENKSTTPKFGDAWPPAA